MVEFLSIVKVVQSHFLLHPLSCCVCLKYWWHEVYSLKRQVLCVEKGGAAPHSLELHT